MNISSSEESNEQNIKKCFSIYKFQEKTLSFSSKKPVEIQLKEAIDSAHVHLNNRETQNSNFEYNLMQSFSQITLILKKSQTQIPAYSKQLKSLDELLLGLKKYFLSLPSNTKIELLKSCSQWPLLHTKNSSLSTLLSMSYTETLTLAEKASLALALIRTKTHDGLFETQLTRLLLPIDATEINHISTAARLIYIFATLVANGAGDRSSLFIKEGISKYLGVMLNYMDDHCSEANSDDMSQFYHGMNYLRIAYPEHFNNLPPRLANFVQTTFKFLKDNNTVTISHQQQQVYDELQKLDPNFKHEVLVGGRQVDFFNPKTRQIIFYNGPSHFLYSPEGLPSALNPATVLSTKTLEQQGYVVTHISYFQWQEAGSERINFLKQIMLPSMKPESLQEERDSSERKTSLAESPQLFWQKFSLPKKSSSKHAPLSPLG